MSLPAPMGEHEAAPAAVHELAREREGDADGHIRDGDAVGSTSTRPHDAEGAAATSPSSPANAVSSWIWYTVGCCGLGPALHQYFRGRDPSNHGAIRGVSQRPPLPPLPLVHQHSTPTNSSGGTNQQEGFFSRVLGAVGLTASVDSAQHPRYNPYEKIPSVDSISSVEHNRRDTGEETEDDGDDGSRHRPHRGGAHAAASPVAVSSAAAAAARPPAVSLPHDDAQDDGSSMPEAVADVLIQVAALNICSCVNVGIQATAPFALHVSIVGPIRNVARPSGHSAARGRADGSGEETVLDYLEANHRDSVVVQSFLDDAAAASHDSDGGNTLLNVSSSHAAAGSWVDPLSALDAIEDLLFQQLNGPGLSDGMEGTSSAPAWAITSVALTSIATASSVTSSSSAVSPSCDTKSDNNSGAPTMSDLRERVLLFAKHVIELPSVVHVALRKCTLDPDGLAVGLALGSGSVLSRLHTLDVEACGLTDAHIVNLGRRANEARRVQRVAVGGRLERLLITGSFSAAPLASLFRIIEEGREEATAAGSHPPPACLQLVLPSSVAEDIRGHSLVTSGTADVHIWSMASMLN